VTASGTTPRLRFSLARIAGDLFRDTLFGLRLFRRSPGFSTIAVLTLGVAIGANTAVFAVVNSLLFDPLPVAAPVQLASIRFGQSRMSWPNYEEVRERRDLFTGVAAKRPIVAGVGVRDTPVRLSGEMTSANFFPVLGVRAALGRTYDEGDRGRALVVLADHAWRVRFGSDREVVGRVLSFDGQPYEVVGVMPPKFRGTSAPGMLRDFWMMIDPDRPNAALRDPLVPYAEVVGRLRPSISHTQANAALTLLAEQIRARVPDLPPSFLEAEVLPVDGIYAFRGMAGTFLPVFAFLGLLTIVAGFVLLIGCANVAGLLLGRAAARGREIATRLALGANRGRVVRQLLTEALLLAIMGGIAGVVLSNWLLGGVSAFSARLPAAVTLDPGIDRAVLFYALGLTTLTALLFGLAPARRAGRFDVVSTLKAESGASGRQRLRHVLVVSQILVCSMLLVWSGLFVRSLGRVAAVDPGFDPSGVLLAHVALPQGAENRARNEQVFVDLQRQVRDSQGVRAAGMSLIVPLALKSNEEFYVTRETDAADVTTNRVRVSANRLMPGWFETLRIPLLTGRDFTWDDREGSPGVVIVNETLAKRFWNGDALGKRLRVPVPRRRTVEVVGIVRDSKYWTIGEATAPAVYLPFRQAYLWDQTLHVRTADMAATTRVIERELARLAPGIAVEITPMTQAVAVAVLPAQVGAALTTAFGLVAILLSALGVYGLVSFTVVQRMREITIRKAMGARTADIIRMVIGSNARWAALALTIGLMLGALGGYALGGFIVGISPTDVTTLVAVSLVVMATVVSASALPAWRAARLPPFDVLRDA
jgi:putative ABC transport system permease protein